MLRQKYSMRGFPIPPTASTLDIDDTCDTVHGQQQLSRFNARHDTPIVELTSTGWNSRP